MKKYSSFIFRNNKVLTILFVLINIIALIGILQIKLNTDFANFSLNQSVYEERLDYTKEVFGDLNEILVVVQADSFDQTTANDIRGIQAHFENLEKVNFVSGPAPEVLNFGVSTVNYIDASIPQLTSYYQSFGEFSPLKTVDGENYFIFTLFINDNFTRQDINGIESFLKTYNYETYISGDTYNQLKIGDYILKILLILPPLAIFIIFFIFKWQMRAFKPTLLSVMPAGIGALWTFGLIGWIGNEISILTAVVPIFVIVIGSADGLHFMSHYQDARKSGQSILDSMVNTLKIVGVPMIITTLTSIAGFLSLLSIQNDSLKDLSIFAGVGIFLAGVATWFILPLILSHDIDISRKSDKDPRIDFSKLLKKLRGIPSLIIVSIIIIVTAFTFSKINNEFNILMVYKDYTIVSKNAKKIDEINGGSIPIFVIIDPSQDVLTTDEASNIDTLAGQINALPEVNKVINPYALMNTVYNSNFGLDIPNDTVLNSIYTSMSASTNSTISHLISKDDNVIRLLVYPKDMNNATLGNIETAVRGFSDNAEVTGVQYLMKELNSSIMIMQIESILLAIGVVFAMLVISLKSFKLAFISILPIIITVTSLYGFLGLTGISLNVTTVIIFSITIGVGIDYAVHFSSVYNYYFKELKDNFKASEKAFNNTSRPIIANALGICLGLTVLMFSPLTIHFNVSILMWVSMIVSVTLTLTLLPMILSHKRKSIKNSK